MSIQRGLKGLYNLRPEPKLPYFDVTSCEVCGSEQPGDRCDFTATLGKPHNLRRVPRSCCQDCFNYLFT